MACTKSKLSVQQITPFAKLRQRIFGFVSTPAGYNGCRPDFACVSEAVPFALIAHFFRFPFASAVLWFGIHESKIAPQVAGVRFREDLVSGPAVPVKPHHLCRAV